MELTDDDVVNLVSMYYVSSFDTILVYHVQIIHDDLCIKRNRREFIEHKHTRK